MQLFLRVFVLRMFKKPKQTFHLIIEFAMRAACYDMTYSRVGKPKW